MRLPDDRRSPARQEAVGGVCLGPDGSDFDRGSLDRCWGKAHVDESSTREWCAEEGARADWCRLVDVPEAEGSHERSAPPARGP
jgi:hypothetical protein